MDYFKKVEENPYEDLFWNIPENKQGTVSIIGGNKNSFKTEIRISELLFKYQFKSVLTVLPDALKDSLPPLDNVKFLSSTDSGSFLKSDELKNLFNDSDFNLLIGDFSKNSITKEAVSSAVTFTEKPALLTRDTVDLIAEENLEELFLNEKIIIFGSLVQIQKLLRSVYYPKMLLLSQSLMQVVEILHKFTLSYKMTIATLHNGQILVAKNGEVVSVPLEKTGFSPITLWNGECAVKIAVLNTFNPNNSLRASVSALFLDK